MHLLLKVEDPPRWHGLSRQRKYDAHLLGLIEKLGPKWQSCPVRDYMQYHLQEASCSFDLEICNPFFSSTCALFSESSVKVPGAKRVKGAPVITNSRTSH
jgi:hypothetical protein